MITLSICQSLLGGGYVSDKQKVPGTQFFAWINKKNSNKNIGYMKLISEVIRMIFLAKNWDVDIAMKYKDDFWANKLLYHVTFKLLWYYVKRNVKEHFVFLPTLLKLFLLFLMPKQWQTGIPANLLFRCITIFFENFVLLFW